jgi:hypothetical protein
MQRVVIALSTLAVVLVAAPSHADLTEQKLLRFWGKYITEPPGDLAKPKAACVCTPGSPNPANLRLGYIRAFKSGPHWYANCWIPDIVNGKVISENGCGDKFEVLSK